MQPYWALLAVPAVVAKAALGNKKARAPAPPRGGPGLGLDVVDEFGER
jgi:hypothetical protein